LGGAAPHTWIKIKTPAAPVVEARGRGGVGQAAMTIPTGARYEIAIDGTTRTYRDREDYAREAATLLKAKHPNGEITVRDLTSGAVTVHQSNRQGQTSKSTAGALPAPG
jgi:hypothetical protein